MNILDQLENRISQLLDNMSLMQMEIDELADKNQYLQDKLARSEDLETEVIKIRAEQALWQERLQQLLGKIDDVALKEEAHDHRPEESYSVQKIDESQGIEESSAPTSDNAQSEYSQSTFNTQENNIEENSTEAHTLLHEDEMPFFDINQNFMPEEPASEYQKQQPLL